MPFKSAFQPEVQSVHQVCNLTRNSKDGSRTFFFEILEAVHCTLYSHVQHTVENFAVDHTWGGQYTIGGLCKRIYSLQIHIKT